RWEKPARAGRRCAVGHTLEHLNLVGDKPAHLAGSGLDRGARNGLRRLRPCPALTPIDQQACGGRCRSRDEGPAIHRALLARSGGLRPPPPLKLRRGSPERLRRAGGRGPPTPALAEHPGPAPASAKASARLAEAPA